MFYLALSLCLLDQLVALAHLFLYRVNECLPLGLDSIFDLLLEGGALRVILGYVFQTPISLFLALIIQRLIDEDVGATKSP